MRAALVSPLARVNGMIPDAQAYQHCRRCEQYIKRAEEMLIDRALEQTDGNIAAAARMLGTNRPRIYKHLEDRKDNET